MPGIAGLLAGVRFVRRQGLDAICRKERRLAQLAAEGLRTIPGVHVWATPDLTAQAGVVSFTADGWDVEELAGALGEREIAVRAGLHCAPLAHRTVGHSGERNGTAELFRHEHAWRSMPFSGDPAQIVPGIRVFF